MRPQTHRASSSQHTAATTSSSAQKPSPMRKSKWSLGILNDKETEEVPGSVLLLSNVSQYNAPLGLDQTPARTSTSSLPPSRQNSIVKIATKIPEQKRTADGIILEPQPSQSANDPLNWPVLRRDAALLSLGFYCFLGGGMTPILAAGFSNVANDLDVTVPQVALTTGLYMMGLGLGSVVLSPTAILYGKRPVYLVSAICFILTCVWSALSPNFASLVVARVAMGFAVSSVECLPSASVAEIYYLHEKATRIGVYTLLLLGGKNIIPLVSAAIIGSLGWRFVFWIVAAVVAFAAVLLFFFVPETFWDRTPKPRARSRSITNLHLFSPSSRSPDATRSQQQEQQLAATIAERRANTRHAHFSEEPQDDEKGRERKKSETSSSPSEKTSDNTELAHGEARRVQVDGAVTANAQDQRQTTAPDLSVNTGYFAYRQYENDATSAGTPYWRDTESAILPSPGGNPYTKYLSRAPRQSFIQQLKPFSGRINHDNWFKVAARPFILYAYPSILWSSLVYSLSVGWLIVLSESASSIYENRSSYNFTPLQVGLVYLAPFIGGIFGTVVAGKVSDLIVRFLSRKNGGIYEPEFRLAMAVPIAITTVVGLMGVGWSAEERDAWIVPTVFFAIISFGCTLGSTTAITFAVDSYRQYAGEALVTLNFSKNIFHGLVWSLFFNRWLDADGSKTVFIAMGGIQLACLLTTIPMYIYGKRARMWTVRRNLMEKF